MTRIANSLWILLALAAPFARAQSQSANPAPAAMDQKFDSLFEESHKAGGAVAPANGPTATDGSLPDGHPEVGPETGGPETGADPHAHAGMGSLLPKPGPVPIVPVHDVKALEAVPVLHEGRLKPMITYARHMLLQFSGRTSYQNLSAMQVMAKILFAPETVGDLRIFLINNPEVAEALGVAPEKSRRYSFSQLEKSLPKLQELADKANALQDEKRNLVQKEVLRVFGNLVEFVNLSRTFSFALPNAAYEVQLAETRALLQLKPGQPRYSFWDLMMDAQPIAKVLEGIGNRGEAQRTPMEREIVALSQAMYMNSQTLHPSPFRCFPIPPAMAAAAGVPGWVSPAEIVAVPEELQSFRKELDYWADAAAAYRAGDQAGFSKDAGDYVGAMENRAYEQLSETHFPLEILYQKSEPFYWGLVLYWFALIACFAYFLTRKEWMYKGALWVFLAGYAVHISGIVARILIMKRPPVTSLFETFPFVAAVSILAALFIERINRKKPSRAIGLLSASLLGVVLLSIANRYAAEGDTMKMLVAVLNSNFWLSTHVVCVTIGYSACLLAGAIGHLWLIRALWPATIRGDEASRGEPADGGRGVLGPTGEAGGKSERLKEISKMVYGTLCFGLLFSFIGTVLGGIWADQSWGRFWGWDPKENGALLIVIWCIILLHAKQWGYIRAFGMAQGAVFGAIVVSLAWFGVNLLNVGLHSYGFTTGAATKLFSYIGGELSFMAATAVGVKLGWGSKPRAAKGGLANPPGTRGLPASQPT
ncbi:MAG: cytochrome c biogenesis protein CcsA [Fibrobacteres bacterium]|nr:cytochrome c biogenesis protein CcsA [Fibrobacterota bacterium]